MALAALGAEAVVEAAGDSAATVDTTGVGVGAVVKVEVAVVPGVGDAVADEPLHAATETASAAMRSWIRWPCLTARS